MAGKTVPEIVHPAFFDLGFLAILVQFPLDSSNQSFIDNPIMEDIRGAISISLDFLQNFGQLRMDRYLTHFKIFWHPILIRYYSNYTSLEVNLRHLRQEFQGRLI